MNEKSVSRWPYEDIVNLPHHVSIRHTPMPMNKRAAQFAPFAALTGYEDAVAETARLTDNRIVLTEDAAQDLNRKITYALEQGLELRIVHFVPDDKKAGGLYRETRGKIRKIEMGAVVMEDGQRIPAKRKPEFLLLPGDMANSKASGNSLVAKWKLAKHRSRL